MNLLFSPQGWEDYLHWQQTDKKIVRRIHELIKDTTRSPFEGIGKPEPLRHALAGFWSRRITEEHRMVYRVSGKNLEIAQLRFHYEGCWREGWSSGRGKTLAVEARRNREAVRLLELSEDRRPKFSRRVAEAQKEKGRRLTINRGA